MNRNLFLGCLLLFLPLYVLAANQPVIEADPSVYKELNQARIDALKESLQKDIQIQTARIEAQEKQLAQQNKLLDSFSARIGDISLFLTGFGLLAGLVGYFTVRSRAQKEARIAAEEWMEKEGKKAIDAKLAVLDQHISTQTDAATAKVNEFNNKIKLLQANANNQFDELQNQISTSKIFPDGLPQRQASASNVDPISILVEALKHKPEAEYGFDDWNARAFDAYKNGNDALAAEYWLQAVRGGKGSGEALAQSLHNAGFCLGKLERHEEAIDVFKQVVTRYGDAPETKICHAVASSLLHMSVSLEKINREEDALHVLNEVISRYGNTSELILQASVAHAYNQRGAVLGRLSRLEDAIPNFDEVISRYENSSDASIRECVAQSLNNKGFLLLRLAKINWGNEDLRKNYLQTAATLLEQSEKEIDNKEVVWGNQAYLLFMLGKTNEASILLKQALQQGGEYLYKVTLDDSNCNPVTLDTSFSALLEEIWSELKPKREDKIELPTSG